VSDPPWLLALEEHLYNCEKVEISEELIEEWWDFPYDPFEIHPPHKDNPVVPETDEN
jgi:hypothetical protein